MEQGVKLKHHLHSRGQQYSNINGPTFIVVLWFARECLVENKEFGSNGASSWELTLKKFGTKKKKKVNKKGKNLQEFKLCTNTHYTIICIT